MCFEQKESYVKWYGVMHNDENNIATWHMYTRIFVVIDLKLQQILNKNNNHKEIKMPSTWTLLR
jgi:hypothetical protein